MKRLSLINASIPFIITIIVTLLAYPASTKGQNIQLELEAWEENPDSGYVSCPWIYCWNGSNYVADNDVYSTARGADREYTDFYTLQKPLFEMNGEYLLELREDGAEHSFTDMVKLVVVDHPSSVRIGSDEAGNIGTYADPSHPISAVSNRGFNVMEHVIEEDSAGASLYHQDFVVVDFGAVDISQGALFVMRAMGFKVEDKQDLGDKTYQQPTMQIQTMNSNGEWVKRNTFYPRDNWATGCYDLSGLLPDSNGNIKVRIFVTSCHTKKYHCIDYIGLDTDPQVPVITNELLPAKALHSNGTNVLSIVAAQDGVYAETLPGQKISMTYSVPPMSDKQRDFIFVCKGYYLPLNTGTYYIQTWNETDWDTVYSATFITADYSDTTHFFDMSSFLPDTDGKYKVRISQSHKRSSAGIDFVGLTKDGEVGNMISAMDLGKGWSVTDTVSFSDDLRDQWGVDSWDTIRIVEIEWDWESVNIPLHQMPIPEEFKLLQNYPNPFNYITTINYLIPITSEVELGVYNLLGQKLITLVSEKQPSGTYEIEWIAKDLASGIYIYRLKAGNYIKTRRMVLQR